MGKISGAPCNPKKFRSEIFAFPAVGTPKSWWIKIYLAQNFQNLVDRLPGPVPVDRFPGPVPVA